MLLAGFGVWFVTVEVCLGSEVEPFVSLRRTDITKSPRVKGELP